MIYHLSIDAREPRRVAGVLAELMGGRATPFPPVAEGSWVAHGGDDRNSLVEVYPRGTQLVEAQGDADAFGLPGESGACATHFAMGTMLSQADVFTIAVREGWPAKYRKRGGAFGVIELWIEGDRMVEVLTQEMQREYLSAMSLSAWSEALAQGASAQAVAA